MFLYREKNNLIFKLHPAASLFYVSAVILLSLAFSHPVYLAGLLFAIMTVILEAEIFREAKPYFTASVYMILMIALVNSVFVNTGSTVLLVGPTIPVLGRVRITLEALAFSAAMGMRLLVIVGAFAVYTHAIDPDKVLGIFGRWGNKSVLAVTICTRLFPLMVGDFRRITEIQQCRGVAFHRGNLLHRVKTALPVINIVLLSSLERSMQLAESMQARGYGSGKRTCFSRDLWRPADSIVVAAAVISLVTGIWAYVKGWGIFSYYPKLGAISLAHVIPAFLIMLFLMVPAVADRGWKKWPSLKSKI